MSSLTTAFYTAALALLGKILFDAWNIHRQRCNIALALAGELEAYIELLRPESTAKLYFLIAGMEREQRLYHLCAIPQLPSGHPVFDKVADRIGLLPQSESFSLSRIYNILTGMRLLITGLSSEQFIEAHDDIQCARIHFIAQTMVDENKPTRDLIARLKRIGGLPFWSHHLVVVRRQKYI